MRKVVLSLALAGILGATSAVAEESGAFAGIQAGYGAVASKMGEGDSGTAEGFRYGVVGGYKQFFSENFGLRYYGVVDNGNAKKDGDKTSTLNANANVDALYNFVSSGSLDFGAFAGLSVGYTTHKPKEGYSISGFDAGANLGLRANIAKAHGVELFGRVGFIQQKKDLVKLSQPYSVGLRYTFSF